MYKLYFTYCLHFVRLCLAYLLCRIFELLCICVTRVLLIFYQLLLSKIEVVLSKFVICFCYLRIYRKKWVCSLESAPNRTEIPKTEMLSSHFLGTRLLSRTENQMPQPTSNSARLVDGWAALYAHHVRNGNRHADVSTSCRPSRTVRPANPIRTRIPFESIGAAPARSELARYGGCGRGGRFALVGSRGGAGRRAAAARAGSTTTTTTSRAHE